MTGYHHKLVLAELHPRSPADELVSHFHLPDASDVEAHRSVKLQRITAGGGLRAAEGDADLLPKLVDEEQGGPRSVGDAGELAEGLAHEARLEAHVRISHVALELGFRRERRDRVDDDELHRARTHEHLGDFEGLFPRIGLRDQQALHVDADPFGVVDIERVLRVDERAHAAAALRLRDRVESEGGLSARLRSVDLHHPPAGIPTDPGRHVEGERAGRDRGDRLVSLGVTEGHDRPLPELLLHARHDGLQRAHLLGNLLHHHVPPFLHHSGLRRNESARPNAPCVRPL